MDFIRKNTPKQFQRNGFIASNIFKNITNNIGGGRDIMSYNYLPAYLNTDTNRFDVVDNVAFYNETALWEFFKRETTQQTTTNENGESVVENINNDTLVLKISPNTITFGDGNEVITTNHFKIDGNNLITDYNIISKGEVIAYGVGSGSTSNNGGTSTITNIVDNLISTSTTDALSANQGRLLNEKINSITTHSHSNKSVLDNITSTNITNWNNAHTNNHTHGTNKNCDVYRLLVGNYGGIRSAETNNDILIFSDDNITLNANGKHLYLGGNNTQTVYIPTYYDNGDGTTTAQWNSFNGNQFYMQIPMRIALQSHNNTQPPIWTNSTNICTNLNADKVDGYDGTQLVNNVGVNGDNITITKGTSTTTITPNFAIGARYLKNTDNKIYLSYYDDYVNITGTGGNIYLGAQQYKNNNYGIYFITNDGTADKEGKIYWNYINGTQLLTQVPHRINLQDTNNTQPPITVNTTTMCPNLNANYLGGYKQSDFVKLNGDSVINGNITINGTLTVSDEITAFATTSTTSLTSKIKTALANVENATTFDDIKSILITLKNSI